MGKRKDLMNKKFGRLTVLRDVGRSKTRGVLWECICECGEKVTVRGSSLSNGSTKSCGCLRRDMLRAKAGKTHSRWKGGRAMHDGYVKVSTPGHPRVDKDNYVREHILVIEKLLGRYLKPGETVHHRNERRADNRPENLKLFATQGEHTAYHAELRKQRKLLGNIWQVIKELVPAAAELRTTQATHTIAKQVS